MDEIFCRYFSELSQLGRGAFGDVSLARRVSDGLLVAVKRVNLGALTDEKALTVCAWEFFFALVYTRRIRTYIYMYKCGLNNIS